MFGYKGFFNFMEIDSIITNEDKSPIHFCKNIKDVLFYYTPDEYVVTYCKIKAYNITISQYHNITIYKKNQLYT